MTIDTKKKWNKQTKKKEWFGAFLKYPDKL